ncbi:unnamed protein product [Urochloa humidicola]
MDVMDDDALGLVLERVDSHVSFIRAAAVCRRWLPPPLPPPPRTHRRWYYHNPIFHDFMIYAVRNDNGPVFILSSPSTVDARHFSLDFLPGGAGSWILQTSRGSLLLMFRDAIAGLDFGILSPNMLVCYSLRS